MFKNKGERRNRNDNIEEFTGFAWMREKKIHQKIGIQYYFIALCFNSLNQDYFICVSPLVKIQNIYFQSSQCFSNTRSLCSVKYVITNTFILNTHHAYTTLLYLVKLNKRVIVIMQIQFLRVLHII